MSRKKSPTASNDLPVESNSGMQVKPCFLLTLVKGNDWLTENAKTALAEEHSLTPFDALHAATAVTAGEQLLTSEQDYDDAGVDRVPLENSK